MGKSWKEKPDKYRKNRDFQKKQKHKNKGPKPQNSDYDPYYEDPWKIVQSMTEES